MMKCKKVKILFNFNYFIDLSNIKSEFSYIKNNQNSILEEDSFNSNFNREPKTCIVGGVQRAMFASQAISAAVREKLKLAEVRAANLEDLIEDTLKFL